MGYLTTADFEQEIPGTVGMLGYRLGNRYYCTVAEAGRYWGVNPETVRRWNGEGMLGVRVGNSANSIWLIPAIEMIAWVSVTKKGRHPTPKRNRP